MQLFDALGPAVAAELSERRALLPTELFVCADALQVLSRALRQARLARVGVLFDRRTRSAAGEACLAALGAAGLQPFECLLEDREGHEPVCDDITQRELLRRLPEVDLVLGVGSGVISDLAKWVAFARERPAAVFATAASMNGYSAANVAPAIDGVKSLFAARAHRWIAAAPRVLAAAPERLTSAGLGDVLAKFVSTADWRLNQLLFGEPYSDAVAAIIAQVEQRFLGAPERLAEKNEGAVGALFEALVFSGAAMTLQGSSMPASGGEHLISHALDMRADAEGSGHDLHGRQVGVATIFVAALYERMLALEQPRFASAPLRLDRQAWGPIADAVAAHHRKQGVRLGQACERLAAGDTWRRARAALRPLVRGPTWVRGVLEAAGAACRIRDLGIDRERFLWAVHNGAQIRERFTSLVLAWATGVLPGAADDIIDAYLG